MSIILLTVILMHDILLSVILMNGILLYMKKQKVILIHVILLITYYAKHKLRAH
jgi:hypothetical protein